LRSRLVMLPRAIAVSPSLPPPWQAAAAVGLPSCAGNTLAGTCAVSRWADSRAACA